MPPKLTVSICTHGWRGTVSIYTILGGEGQYPFIPLGGEGQYLFILLGGEGQYPFILLSGEGQYPFIHLGGDGQYPFILLGKDRRDSIYFYSWVKTHCKNLPVLSFAQELNTMSWPGLEPDP